jgi:methionine sulfoxide reductase heme-binding subunit
MPVPPKPLAVRLTGLLRDPAGRLSWLKGATLGFALLPLGILWLRWSGDDLGPRPITEAIHVTGLWAIRFLILTLAVTPLRAVLDWGRVVMLRRMLGVTAACWAGAHFLLFWVDKHWDPLMVVSEIALRFYLTIGFAVLLGLATLAWTSTDGWQRRLGARWKRLHRIVYWLAVLALFHYAVQSKADVTNAVFLAGLFAWLMFWRIAPRRWQKKLWPVAAYAAGAAATSAVVEAGWYAVRNRVDPLLVLQANLDLPDGPSPAVWVLVSGLALFALAALRRLGTRRRRAVPPGAAARRA